MKRSFPATKPFAVKPSAALPFAGKILGAKTPVFQEPEIPQTYQDLQKDWGDYIHLQVRRHNKVFENGKDLEQHIWMKLLEADVLGKFWAKAQSTTPKLVNKAQVVAWLGVRRQTWETCQYFAIQGVVACDRTTSQNYKAQGLPVPREFARSFVAMPVHPRTGQYIVDPTGKVDYTTHGTSTWYRTEDILRMIQEKTFRTAKLGSAPKMVPTVGQFRGYLNTAIANHFRNFCRTADRRHKERTFDTILNRSQTHNKEGDSTMDSLVELMVPPTEAHQETEACLNQALAPAGLIGRSKLFQDMILRGYTLREALMSFGMDAKQAEATQLKMVGLG